MLINVMNKKNEEDEFTNYRTNISPKPENPVTSECPL